MSYNVVPPEELKYFVESLRAFQVAQIGSDQWLDVHEKIIKLNQQAALEAAEHREEEVKELLLLHDKLHVLVSEAYCVSLWKTRILPHLLQINPNPEATFLIYTIFFHEGSIIALLDTCLFHATACQALGGCAIDLVDYCVQGVSQLIGLTSMDYRCASTTDLTESILSELERQKRDMIYKIGLRCISILSYFAENASAMPLGAIRHMVAVHDVPWLMADILHYAPWQRVGKKGKERFIDDKWLPVTENTYHKVTKYEAQAWFCLRQLLFNSSLMESYEMTKERCHRLAGCETLLYEYIVDQLPPLVELKQYLCQLHVVQPQQTKKSKADLLLQEVPEIRENLIKGSEKNGGFVRIAQDQESIFLDGNKDAVFKIAQRLSVAYNTDLLAEMEEKAEQENDLKPSASDSSIEQKCSKCMTVAWKKCSKCQTTFYCSRECQVGDWPKHKLSCKGH